MYNSKIRDALAVHKAFFCDHIYSGALYALLQNFTTLFRRSSLLKACLGVGQLIRETGLYFLQRMLICVQIII